MGEQDHRYVAPAYPPPPPVDDLDHERVRAQAQGRSFGQPPQQIRIARYVVDVQMGQGATGVVYRAHDEHLRRMVALKLLNASVAQTPQHQERLMREARAMAQLSHPNVVAVHEIGLHEGRLFIAMELLQGGTLKQWLSAQPRDPKTVIRTLIAAGRGLEAAHRLGLVHRDLKPDNILVGTDDRPRIVDFGLVGHHADIAHAPTTPAHMPVHAMTLTATGALLGTPAYMAPEQLMGRPADALSDQFAFCVTAYEALFGERPYRADNFVQQVNAVTTGQIQPPPARRGVPAAVTKAILRGLAVDPQQRHPSMTSLLATMERALGPGKGVVVGAIATAAVFATVVVGGGIWWWLNQKDDDAAIRKHEAKAKALLDAGKSAACVEYALKHPVSRDLLSYGLTCSYTLQDYGKVEEVCDTWRDTSFPAPPLETCHPASVKHFELLAKQKWEECLALAREQEEIPHFLSHQLVCAGAVNDVEAYEHACTKLRKIAPDNASAGICLDTLKSMRSIAPSR